MAGAAIFFVALGVLVAGAGAVFIVAGAWMFAIDRAIAAAKVSALFVEFCWDKTRRRALAVDMAAREERVREMLKEAP